MARSSDHGRRVELNPEPVHWTEPVTERPRSLSHDQGSDPDFSEVHEDDQKNPERVMGSSRTGSVGGLETSSYSPSPRRLDGPVGVRTKSFLLVTRIGSDPVY